MNKKYIVRLSDTERGVLREVIKQLKGSSQKVRRAQILLKADVDGPGWTDEKSADAFSCRVQTVESIRRRLVTEGFEVTLNGRKPDKPVWSKNSCGFTLVVFEEAPEPFTTLNWTCTGRVLADRRKEQHIALALMVPLLMKVFHILPQHMVERRFPTQDHP